MEDLKIKFLVFSFFFLLSSCKNQNNEPLKNKTILSQQLSPDNILFNGAITSSTDFYCEIDKDSGLVECVDMGSGSAGIPEEIGRVKYISYSHYREKCFITDDNLVGCWDASEDTPIKMGRDFKNPKMVSTIGGGYCVLDDEGVFCHDNSTHRQDVKQPDLLNPGEAWSLFNHSCAFDEEGLKCWGNNFYSQSTVPSHLKNPVSFTGTGNTNCIATKDTAQCFGWRASELNNFLSEKTNISFLSIIGVYLCAISDNEIDCFHASETAAYGSHLMESPPENIDLSAGIINNQEYALGLDFDGRLLCWIDDSSLSFETHMCDKIQEITSYR